MSESRSKINDKEKMKRSDKCGMDCRFKDEASNKCMFEIRLFKNCLYIYRDIKMRGRERWQFQIFTKHC